MAKLTQAFIKRIECEEGKSKQEFVDDEIKGFFLEVRLGGGKTFYLRTIDKDKKRKYTKLGDAKVLSLADARIKALKLKKAIEDGKDVIIDTPKQENKVPTLKEFYLDYYLPFIQKHVKSWRHNDSLMRVHILPVFGTRKMDGIKKHEIMKAHNDMIEKKKKKPSTANKFLIFLSQAYTIALDLEIDGINENPAKKVKPFTENNERQRYLTKKEAKKLMHAVKESQNPNLQYIVPFLILTGARRGEVLRAKWSDINLEMRLWTIPTSKSGKKRILPISEALLELIRSIPKLSAIYLFPSPKTGKPQNDFYSSWNRARIKAGIKDVRLHDLRHSFASALVNSGRSLYEVQMLLGHSNMKMTQRYAHLNNESLMNAASCASKLLS